MALIICEECNKKISDKATKCIHCGHPLKEEVTTQQTEQRSGCGLIVLIALGIILAVVIMSLF